MNLTLVPAALAKPGYRFRNYGDQQAEECDGCPVRALCFKIPGGHYEVTEIRDVKHPCKLHEGPMAVCLVTEVPVTTVLESKLLKGTAANWSPISCGFPECPNNALCHPRMDAGHMEIVSAAETVECPMHYEINKVVLKPLVL